MGREINEGVGTEPGYSYSIDLFSTCKFIHLLIYGFNTLFSRSPVDLFYVTTGYLSSELKCSAIRFCPRTPKAAMIVFARTTNASIE